MMAIANVSLVLEESDISSSTWKRTKLLPDQTRLSAAPLFPLGSLSKARASLNVKTDVRHWCHLRKLQTPGTVNGALRQRDSVPLLRARHG
jgi:hypothetical protein